MLMEAAIRVPRGYVVFLTFLNSLVWDYKM